jgi:hypothetical protein
MNDHLKPALSLLAELDKAGMEYWVYGGVSIAAYAGRFIRENKDVDVFVREDDFDRSEHVLNLFCIENRFGLESDKSGVKPKINIIIRGEERFSMIAVYETADSIVIKYQKTWGGDEYYSKQLLERVERKISDFRFFTPPDRYIKEMFKNHIKARPKKKCRPEFITDARAILSPEELADLNWKI